MPDTEATGGVVAPGGSPLCEICGFPAPICDLVGKAWQKYVDEYIGRKAHAMFFGPYYAPGGGPDCGYRGIGNENVNLRGIEGLLGEQSD